MLPPFKQRGTKYFLYFLLLAFVDPIRLVFAYVRLADPMQTAVVFELLCIYSLINKNNINRYSILSLIIIYLFTYKALEVKEIRIIGIALQTIILLIILYDFLINLSESKSINLFFMFFIFYQITVILKFIAVIVDVKFGIVQFYLTTLLEIAFALLFTFISINTKDFRLFKESEELLGDESQSE